MGVDKRLAAAACTVSGKQFFTATNYVYVLAYLGTSCQSTTLPAAINQLCASSLTSSVPEGIATSTAASPGGNEIATLGGVAPVVTTP